jgi:hypothetical protein
MMAMIIDAGSEDMIGWADGFFESVSPEKIRATFAFLREEVAGLFKGDGIGGMFKGIGRSIGEGIKELSDNALTQEKREDIAAALGVPISKMWASQARGLGGGSVVGQDD